MNNPGIYDAVIAGVGGATQSISDQSSGATIVSYADHADSLATAVDALIAPIAGGASASQMMLMSHIASGLGFNRFLGEFLTPTVGFGTVTSSPDYAKIAQVMVDLFLEMETFLINAPLPGGGGAVPVNRVMFVDSINADVVPANRNGNLNKPWATIQEGIDGGVAKGWNNFIVMVAPNDTDYSDPIVVPGATTADSIAISGWIDQSNSYNPVPDLAGNITCVTDGSGPTKLQLANVFVTAPSIQSDTVDHDVDITITNSSCVSDISARRVFLTLSTASVFGNIVGSATTVLTSDGVSWGQLIEFGGTISPAATYLRRFYDSAVDYTQQNMIQSGLAVGATAMVTINAPTSRIGDWATLTPQPPIAVDYSFSFHHSDDGTVVFALTNLSRDGGGGTGDFNEPVYLKVEHGVIPEVSSPP
jgi:hypothetical protein